MMPRTLACFGLALLVLLAALLLPSPQPRVSAHHPLDLQGVRAVQVIAPKMVSVTIDAGSAPAYWLDAADKTATVRREGERLVLETDADGYLALNVLLPPTVETLVVAGARIHAESRPARLDVQGSGTLYWTGDAGELRLHDLRAAPPPGNPGKATVEASPATGADCLGDCGRAVVVEWGRIERLDVHLQGGGVALQRPGQVGVARLHLGPRAWFSLGQAQRLDNLEILRGPPATSGIDEGNTD